MWSRSPGYPKNTTSWALMSLKIRNGSVIFAGPARPPSGREGLATAPPGSRRRGRRGVRMSQRRRGVLYNLRLRPRSRGLRLLSGGSLIAVRNEGYPSPCRRIRHPDKGASGGGGRLEPSPLPFTPKPLPRPRPPRRPDTQTHKSVNTLTDIIGKGNGTTGARASKCL